MRLTSAQKILVAAALSDRHHLAYGEALDYADTAAGALEVDDPELVVAVAILEGPA